MCRLLPKSASATIGHRRINRIGFFSRSPFTPGFLFFNVITRRCPFLSLPDFFFIYVIARLDRAICLSPPLNFPDTPVKPEYDNKKHHHPTGSFLPCPVFYFLCHCLAFYFMSLPDFFFIYVIARLDRAIRLSLSQSAELNFPFFQNKIHCLFHQIKE